MNVMLMTSHLNMGGITRYMLTLPQGLRARAHEVHVVSSGGAMLPLFEQMGAEHLQLPIKTKSELNPNLYLSLRPLAEYVRQHEIEIIHAQTRVTQVMGSLMKRKNKIPYVSTCHGYFKTRLFRQLWPCWGDVIAISPAVATHLHQDFKVPAYKIHLVSHGIDLADFAQITPEERMANRRQLGLTDELTIGMIARLSDVKGQDILIAAMPQIIWEVPRAKLLLFGEGKMKEQLLELVKRLRLQDYVEFFPIVAKTRASLSAIDCFAVPSRQEGLGLSVMEAQACGVAVVASDVGGIPSLIENRQTGILVKPKDVKALASAIITVLKDDEFRYSLGVSARRKAFSQYSSNQMIDKTIDVYKKVLTNEKYPRSQR